MHLFTDFLAEEVEKAIRDGEERIVLGITLGNASIGAAAGYAIEEDHFFLESIYIEPELRRQGAGSQLLDAFLAVLHEIDEQMVVTMEFREDNDGEAESLMAFLFARGIPESESDLPGGCHRFVFFAED
jgi:ribosomal protein S18 acetylase RimI-like enzyme